MGLEVTLASYARGAESLGGCGEIGRSSFPSLIGSTVADTVASHSKYSLPTVSGFTTAVASVDTFRQGVTEGFMIANLTQGTQSMGGVIPESGEEEVPLAVLSRQLKKKVTKQVEALRLSGEGCPNPIPRSS